MNDKDIPHIIEGLANFTLFVGEVDEDSNTIPCYLDVRFVDDSLLERFWMPIKIMAISNWVRIMFNLPNDGLH